MSLAMEVWSICVYVYVYMRRGNKVIGSEKGGAGAHRDKMLVRGQCKVWNSQGCRL